MNGEAGVVGGDRGCYDKLVEGFSWLSSLNISNFIWGIADDVLRDVFVRGKYRDVILPMTVIRRLDAVLEPTKQEVLAMKERLDTAGVDQSRCGSVSGFGGVVLQRFAVSVAGFGVEGAAAAFEGRF